MVKIEFVEPLKSYEVNEQSLINTPVVRPLSSHLFREMVVDSNLSNLVNNESYNRLKVQLKIEKSVIRCLKSEINDLNKKFFYIIIFFILTMIYFLYFALSESSSRSR